MTVYEVLLGMRDLLDSPERWTRGVFGRDEQGHMVGALNDRARAWCLVGAACKVDPHGECVNEARDILGELAGGELTAWNDRPERTHAEVIDLLDRAIAARGPNVMRRLEEQR